MVPNIGEAHTRVVTRLRPRNIDDWCYNWQQQRRHETWDFVVASDCVPERHWHAADGAVTLVLTLWVPKAISEGAIGARGWQRKRECHVMTFSLCHLYWSDRFFFELTQRKGYKRKIWLRGRVGKPLTDVRTKQVFAQSPGGGGKAKIFLAMVVLLFFSTLGKDEVLSLKLRNAAKY